MNLNKKKQEQNRTRKGMEIEWPNEPVNSAELGSAQLNSSNQKIHIFEIIKN